MASCHSKKSVSVSEQTRYDTTAVRNGSAETAISVSVLRELAADGTMKALAVKYGIEENSLILWKK